LGEELADDATNNLQSLSGAFIVKSMPDWRELSCVVLCARDLKIREIAAT
jgi:hypothetical protein